MKILLFLRSIDTGKQQLVPSMLTSQAMYFVLCVLAVTDKGGHMKFLFLGLAYFSQRNDFQLGPCYCKNEK